MLRLGHCRNVAMKETKSLPETTKYRLAVSRQIHPPETKKMINRFPCQWILNNIYKPCLDNMMYCNVNRKV